MNEMNLSKRLKRVADFLPKEAVFADIGSDHAYLPCYAILHHKALKAIAGEITDGPLQSAKQQVHRLELDEQISVRKGNGLEVIEKGEVNAVTIAGMGGALIASILNEGKHKLTGQERLILQPNIHAHHIRLWLYQEGYELMDEVILEEDGKIYEIIIAETGDKDKAYEGMSIEKGMLVGPFLAKEQNDVFRRKWMNELQHMEHIEGQIQKAAPTEENKERLKELNAKIKMLKEVLTVG
ncbi:MULTISPECIES: tRNA (adenine(22)-N(1))-methyltransferase [Bacillus]|uniref:tRNA (adenine(22)-N(1))-methyltransferase n=1 Tax=Bacillus TaxID=1386 RepID=UPI0002E1A741|nr:MULTISPECIES: tRNA (adenine(22)-N(1))-methyltransferase TrmK [Bacillus]AHL72110.1 SAM-dependent methyltransferase [Bacillus pumilus]MBY0187742.1 tRNA (adenine-N(1))-methyltransferase [Bacillus aerophilus]NQW96649.1 tRNA (adenine-N(1))-methyltransferase [Bacillus stratosphericus]AKU33006.1 SAM-dependent methyltransferase [Bacillus altitudinis]KSU69526.1 SAM-dependent methyltransferase [Bacillus altitudinis]